jgi:AcrR family transcriptional regulator
MALGRPRAFDTDKALDRALKIFWKKGYEGTSLADLTAALRINRPSLYAAFGNKEALFRKALDRYVEGPGSYVREALEAPTSRVVVQRLLHGTIDLLTDPRNPRGCLMVQGALACGDAAGAVRQELASRRIAVQVALRRRFEQAKVEGDLAADVDPDVLARYVATIIQGMSVQAAGGASRDELRRIAELVLSVWPG